MAWIPMRTDLEDDPAVIAIAAALELEVDLVVGKLHRLWSWANQQLLDGNARGVTESWVDRKVSAPGFARAMAQQGWLELATDGVRFPKFDSWNSKSGKSRAVTARRVAAHRLRKCNGSTVTKSVPTEQKSTEEKKEPPLPPKGGGGYSPAFEVWWIEYPRKREKGEAFKEWGKAVSRIASSRELSRPDAEAWLLEVTKVFSASPAGKAFVLWPARWLKRSAFDDDQREWQRPRDGECVSGNRGSDSPARVRTGRVVEQRRRELGFESGTAGGSSGK